MSERFTTAERTIIVVGILVVLSVAIVVAVINSQSQSKEPDLNARVDYGADTIVIHNEDDFDWTDVYMEINNTYSLTAEIIRAGSQITISMVEFTKPDGERFNPLTHKFSRLTIQNRGRNGGFWAGTSD
jgi:hypothetical protein